MVESEADAVDDELVGAVDVVRGRLELSRLITSEMAFFGLIPGLDVVGGGGSGGTFCDLSVDVVDRVDCECADEVVVMLVEDEDEDDRDEAGEMGDESSAGSLAPCLFSLNKHLNKTSDK